MRIWNGQPYFTIQEAARYLNVPLEKLLDCAFEGQGPYHEFHRDEILYRPTDVDIFHMVGGFQ